LSSVTLGWLAYGQLPEGVKARDAFFSAVDILNAGKGTAAQRPRPPRRNSADRSGTGQAGQKPSESAHVLAPPNYEDYFRDLPVQDRPPLGLNYRVLKAVNDDMFVEADTKGEFHTGDRIRLSVMCNQNGYLYVISRGASGEWSALFPHPKLKQGNDVVAGRAYEFPGTKGDAFRFTDRTGDERLFLLLSKVPVSNLDKVIADLRSPPPEQPGTPVSGTKSPLTDGFMAGIRDKVRARDLVFDHVAPAASQTEGENGDYVVNQKNGDTVMVDFTLKHK
jgi:hypothetical protein